MIVIVSLLFFAVIILFALGMIRPKLAFMPSRKRVALVYIPAFVIVNLVGAALAPLPDDQGTPTAETPAAETQPIEAPAVEATAQVTEPPAVETQPAEPEATTEGARQAEREAALSAEDALIQQAKRTQAEKTAVPEWTPALEKRWCAALKERDAISQALTDEYVGANPNEALQPGAILVLEEKTVIRPRPVRQNRTLEQTLDDIEALVTVPPGQTIEILARTTGARGNLMYVGRWVEGGIEGRILPVTFMWLNTTDAMGRQAEARDAEFVRRWHPILIAEFGSVEAGNAVQAQAFAHGIYAYGSCK